MKVIILGAKKENFFNLLGDEVIEGVCSLCKSPVFCGKMTYEQATKKTKDVAFYCNDCYKTLPRFGKMLRPSREIIQRLREMGVEGMDEAGIRERMRIIKRKEF